MSLKLCSTEPKAYCRHTNSGSGIYDNLKKFNLPYPEAIFDIRYFRSKPEPFYEWAKEFFPGVNYQPNDAHWFIKRLHDHQKLLRLFTQNIDGLERLTDLPDEKLVFAHGSFSTASCTFCGSNADIDTVKASILKDEVPYCTQCSGLVKPDIVFFGENLPIRFFTLQDADPELADLLICIGTSLEVYPFANLADLVPDNVVRVLINRDTVGSFGRRKSDIILNGDIIDIVHKLEKEINW